MALGIKLFNLAKMTTATTGTGTITLGSVVAGFLSFANAGVSNLDVVRYTIREGSNSEVGYGTYTSAGTTLTRNPIRSTNANAAITLAGSAEVSITPAAEDLVDALTPPNGRLSLVSGQAVMTANQTAKNTIYWTHFPNIGTPDTTSGPWLPSFDGTATEMIDCGGEKSFILDTTNHLNNNTYDFFWDDAGSRLVTGPAWTNSTTRSAALAFKNGWLTNSGSMTGRISNNGGTTTIAANRGFYLGSIRTTANGQTGMNFNPTPAAGGTNNILGLFNAYNRVLIAAICQDSTSSWTYASNAWRPVNNNANNSISYLDGLGEVTADACYMFTGVTTTSSGIAVGINLNSTTAQPEIQTTVWHPSGGSIVGEGSATVVQTFFPALGLNKITAMETVGAGVGTQTMYGSGWDTLITAVQGLILKVFI